MSGKKQPTCSKCGRRLTDPYSIAVGMGPECRGGAARAGKSLPKPRWKVQGGRVTFDGLTAAAPLPAAPVETNMPQTWVLDKRAQAHWVKIFGASFFLTACALALPRDAGAVETERIALAGAPGRSYRRPLEDIPTCEACLKKAQEQA